MDITQQFTESTGLYTRLKLWRKTNFIFFDLVNFQVCVPGDFFTGKGACYIVLGSSGSIMYTYNDLRNKQIAAGGRAGNHPFISLAVYFNFK